MQHFIIFLTSTPDAKLYSFPYFPSNATLYHFPYFHSKCNILSISLLAL